MGSVSSTHKRKKRGKIITILHDKYTQTTNTLPSVRDGSSYRCRHHLSSRQPMQRRSMPPLPSITFDKPSSDKSNIHSHRPNSYVAQAFNRTTDRTDPPRVSSTSDIVHNTSHHEHRTLTRVKSFSTIDATDQLNKQNIDGRSHTMERSASIPIDTFLIDISNEYVHIDRPVSMNIRHLLLKTPEDNRTNSSVPVRTKPAATTTNLYENLRNHIPDICEKYSNLTVDPDQPTHNILHARLPSQFSNTMT